MQKTNGTAYKIKPKSFLEACIIMLTGIKQKRGYARVQQELCNISP